MKKYIISFLIALTLVASSPLFERKEVNSLEGLQLVSFGLPIPFVHQSFSRIEDAFEAGKISFPWRTHFQSPLEYPIVGSYKIFFINVVLVWIFVFALYMVGRCAYQYMPVKKTPRT